jgi:phytoene desaturase
MKKIAVIGAGFAGLSAACCLAKEGFEVTLFEKNDLAGGRARKFESSGYTFDMGPSWYWMPDVFERFFNRFGKKTSDFYKLERLDPSYRIFYSSHDIKDVPAGVDALVLFFESIEKGSGPQLLRFLDEGKYKYESGVQGLVYKPGLSVAELLDVRLLKGIFRLHMLRSVSSYVRKYFTDARLIQLLEFPVLFLGAPASKTPALYTLMNYADMVLGTWYPQGGMYKIIEAMVAVATEQGVRFEFSSPVERLEVNSTGVRGLVVNGVLRTFDYVIAGADYHHVEQELLPKEFRRYSERYWRKRVMAPSCILYYLGINKRLINLLHHNLFFDSDFARHSREIYETPQWPTNPLFYVCCPSQTDSTVAPPGHENIFVLIPVAPGLEDSEQIREKYFNQIMDRLEHFTKQSIRESIVYKRSYANDDFIRDYHAFRGNAYGLANTLMQTANFKPSIANKKVNNLFYTGQLTVPGPGMPPSIISGQVVADELIKRVKSDSLRGSKLDGKKLVE